MAEILRRESALAELQIELQGALDARRRDGMATLLSQMQALSANRASFAKLEEKIAALHGEAEQSERIRKNLLRFQQNYSLVLDDTTNTDVALIEFGRQQDFAPFKVGLFNSEVTDAGLAELTRQEQIKSLDLRLCRRLTDEGMKHVALLPHIEVLYLNSTMISDTGLLYLAPAVNLREVVVTGTKVSSVGIATFKKTHPQCRIRN